MSLGSAFLFCSQVVAYATVSNRRRFRAACSVNSSALLSSRRFWWQGDDEARAVEDEQFGAPRGAPGQWASCLRTIDPGSLQTTRRAPIPTS